MLDLAVKLVSSALFVAIGGLWSTYALFKITTSILHNGFKKTFANKQRRVPSLYESWKPRDEPETTETQWNHSYVTTPVSGLRFHYVWAGQCPEHISFELDGDTTLSCHVKERTTKLVLCLHGFPECWFSWRHLLREFEKRSSKDDASYFVVAMDMRGYGGSDVPTGIASYHLTQLSSDVKNVVTSLGYEVCVLVAHDWGGVVAWEVSERYPEILEGMMVLNCPHPKAGVDIATKSLRQVFIKSWYMFFFMVPALPEIYISHNNFWFLRENLNGGGKWKTTKLTSDELEVYSYSLGGASTKASINYYRALILPIYQQKDRDKRMPSATAKYPIRLVWGTQDPYMGVAMAERTKVYLPANESPNSRSEVLLVADAGHFLQQDKPHQVTHLVREFLADLYDS
uniref:AB hydrolase-1 domain-containing protein n=1 Tax=Ciona savignyi TaxID=51511 RepID=H2ZN10_CIOSA